jgi:energy-coupling factor transport system permease protein
VLPGALYELGVAVVVCLSVAPQLVESVQRVRRARRLRAGSRSGFRALRSIALPVLNDALERSLQLAAAMDSRGYGRTGTATPRTRRITAALLLLGMAGLSVGAYGLMDATAPQLIGLPAMLGGSALCCVGLALGGRRVSRSSYRPDSWRAAEWAVAASGVAAAAVMILAVAADRAGFATSFDPLVWPALPTWGVIGMLLGATATVLAPPPPRPEASRPVVAWPPDAVADAPVAAPELVS